MARILGVIPVRMAASRLPGKPLLDLGGRPMLSWVVDVALRSPVLDAVVVATPDEEIARVAAELDVEVELTGDHHRTGSDRVAEVAGRRPGHDVVVNIQGDAPFLTPAMIELVVAPFGAGDMVDMTTVAAPLDRDRVDDPNTVKVVCTLAGDALYFSRSPIPHVRHPGDAPFRRHLGLYAFTRDFLLRYPTLEPTPLEALEGLEQLRALEHGYRIRVCPVDRPTLDINTVADLDEARRLIAAGEAAPR